MQHSETKPLPAADEKEKRRSGLRFRTFVFAALALLLIWAGVKTWRVGSAALSLLETRTQAEQMMAAGLTQINPDEAEALVLDVRADVLVLKQELNFMMPLLARMGWVPRYGALLENAPHFMEMADAGTETAAYAVRGLKPGLSVMQDEALPGEEKLAALVQVLDQARPDLAQAAVAFDNVIAARNALSNEAALPGRVQSLLQQADALTPLALDGFEVVQVLPQILGVDGTKRYLIMAQNEDELRATGGFITGGGMLVVENGRILDLAFQDSYAVDNWREKPYDLPPDQLYELMGFELFLFRDANFWPDFPTSAQTAMALYAYGQDTPPLDGAIAIDQQFLELLLAGTGPLPIPELEMTLTSDNVIQTLRDQWARDEGEDVAGWVGQRKSFFGTFASALLNRVQQDFTNVNPIDLAQNMHTAIETKRLQLYMTDPDVAAVLDELDWDGRLEAKSNQDFLFVVDTNVGFNKVNLYTTRHLAYDVALQPDGHGVATLTAERTHAGERKLATCRQSLPNYRDDPTYLGVANGCFWNYWRIYAPENSRLLQSDVSAVAGSVLYRGETWHAPAQAVSDLPGWATFANLQVIAQAQTVSETVIYQLPQVVTTLADGRSQYTLTIPKQAGAAPETVRVTVQLPPQATFVSATPETAVVANGSVTFNLTLTSDTVVSITFQE